MHRLSSIDLKTHLSQYPPESHSLIRHLRNVILDTAPESTEAVRFNSLSYFLPDQPYGAIGGNICMIECRRGRVALAFIHGAQLPDPDGLLQGTALSKRRVPINTLADARRDAVRTLIRSAVRFAAAEKPSTAPPRARPRE